MITEKERSIIPHVVKLIYRAQRMKCGLQEAATILAIHQNENGSTYAELKNLIPGFLGQTIISHKKKGRWKQGLISEKTGETDFSRTKPSRGHPVFYALTDEGKKIAEYILTGRWSRESD